MTVEQHIVAASAEEWACVSLLISAGAMVVSGNVPPEGFFSGKGEVKREEVAHMLSVALPVVRRIEDEVNATR